MVAHSLSPLLGSQSSNSNNHDDQHRRRRRYHLCEDNICISLGVGLRKGTSDGNKRISYVKVRAATTQQSGTNNPRPREMASPGVDTRIHWENEDEGWVGGKSAANQSEKDKFNKTENERTQDILGEKFSELLDNSTDSHYQFLGVSAKADLEEIKSVYRRLSKEYHPDTTSLPLKAASEKFMKLRVVYDTLSDKEKRRFYDWTLAQEAASREAEKMRMKLKDPYMQEIENFESVPDMVDRLGGRNLELSGEAKYAITFDIFVIFFAICTITYVVLFRVPDY